MKKLLIVSMLLMGSLTLSAAQSDKRCHFSGCNWTFSKAFHLDQHYISMHLRIPIQCPHCPYIGITGTPSIRSHIVSQHHSGFQDHRSILVDCSSCEKSYPYSRVIKHIKRRHPEGLGNPESIRKFFSKAYFKDNTVEAAAQAEEPVQTPPLGHAPVDNPFLNQADPHPLSILRDEQYRTAAAVIQKEQQQYPRAEAFSHEHFLVATANLPKISDEKSKGFLKRKSTQFFDAEEPVTTRLRQAPVDDHISAAAGMPIFTYQDIDSVLGDEQYGAAAVIQRGQQQHPRAKNFSDEHYAIATAMLPKLSNNGDLWS